MKPEPIESSFQSPPEEDLDARLEHLASVISGNPCAGGGGATLGNLRELYASGAPALIRFVDNLLHCAVCSSTWRCEDCDYRQVARDRTTR